MEDIINAIATDASASEVSDALKNALFAKTGERIDAMKSKVASTMFDQPEAETEVEAETETEVTDTPEEEEETE
tara:strand:+ start:529 stop:750 length:222 start_codon:yes stop_codon:yes gene_type:complete